MLRLRLMLPLLVVGTFWGGFLMGDDKKETIIVAPRLPNYYRYLNLAPKQRIAILKIRQKYAVQRQELLQKIDELKDKDREDCEKVLTASQKAQLKELRRRSNRGRGGDDDDEPIRVERKKSTPARDKKKAAEAKDKKAPQEIKK